MHYPWWYVPQATAPMLIALIAVVHVLVSHYAVGGGLFLAIETGYAYRSGDQDYLGYLRRHARFFILLTVVFGAITGVGIWWTIGLASPLATEVLIRTFVFGWAMEYVFFIVEIASAFIFYYFWGRMKPKIHLAIGWIYAMAAWVSLVLITGITGFMLNPGPWLAERNNFWVAFLNPQCIPQIFARTGGTLLLTSLYVYVHASLSSNTRLHHLIQQRSTRPAVLGAVLIVVGGAGWLVFLPESARAVLTSAAVLNVFLAQLVAITTIVFVLLYLGPYRNPGSLSTVAALALMVLGISAFTVGEFVREAVRKPYVVYNLVLGNQILPEEVETLRKTGYLEGGVWTRAYVAANYPQAMRAGHVDRQALLGLPQADRQRLGAVLFQYHCNDCHAVDLGYSAVGPMIRGQTRPMLLHTIKHLGDAHFFMPPWSGTPEEAELLADYLEKIAPARPAGMAPGKE
jgi:cytochrome d ubiquinol oxidase subunit I